MVVRRIPDALTTAEAVTELEKHAAAWPILDLTPLIVVEAARCVRDYGFSYWDAQIWATTKLHRLNAVFTEDMNVGSAIEGVAIVNPLLDSFDLNAWLLSSPSSQ